MSGNKLTQWFAESVEVLQQDLFEEEIDIETFETQLDRLVDLVVFNLDRDNLPTSDFK
jgi:hypothetical protein